MESTGLCEYVHAGSIAQSAGAGRRQNAPLRLAHGGLFSRATPCRPSCAYTDRPRPQAVYPRPGAFQDQVHQIPRAAAGLGSSTAACPMALPFHAPLIGVAGVRSVRTALLGSGASGITAELHHFLCHCSFAEANGLVGHTSIGHLDVFLASVSTCRPSEHWWSESIAKSHAVCLPGFVRSRVRNAD